MWVTDLFRDLPGLRVASIGRTRVVVKGRLGCRPTSNLDGVELRIPDDETLDEYLLASSLSTVEVYARPPFPAQYAPRSTGVRQCASIVLWAGYVDGTYQQYPGSAARVAHRVEGCSASGEPHDILGAA